MASPNSDEEDIWCYRPSSSSSALKTKPVKSSFTKEPPKSNSKDMNTSKNLDQSTKSSTDQEIIDVDAEFESICNFTSVRTLSQNKNSLLSLMNRKKLEQEAKSVCKTPSKSKRGRRKRSRSEKIAKSPLKSCPSKDSENSKGTENDIANYFSPSKNKSKSRKRKSSESVDLIICSSSSEQDGNDNEKNDKLYVKKSEVLDFSQSDQEHPEPSSCENSTFSIKKDSPDIDAEWIGEIDAMIDNIPVVDVVVEGYNEDSVPEPATAQDNNQADDLKSDLGGEGGFFTEKQMALLDKRLDTTKSESAQDVCDGNESDADLFEFCEKADKLDAKTEQCLADSEKVDTEMKIDGFNCDAVDNVIDPSAPRKQTSIFSFFKPRFLTSSSTILLKTDNVQNNAQNNKLFGDVKARPGLRRGRTFSASPTSSSSSSSSSLMKSSSVPSSTFDHEDKEPASFNGRKKQCPFYKKIPGTVFTVDAFRYGSIPGCLAYILTHFHYDHYGGLTKKFAHPIYCSEVTANLVESRLGVDPKWVNRLHMWKPCKVEGVVLTLMEANHCPGAVIILFELPNGKKILHTGDFRACREMEEYEALKDVRISELYLDTTYCNPSYAFPPQREVIDFVVSLVKQYVKDHPQTLFVCGAYTIGKEKIFSAIANALDSKICVFSDKKKVLDCLEDKDLKSRVTLDWKQGRVHVLPMGKLNQKTLSEHLSRHNRFSSILAFKPTGWTHSDRTISLADLRPQWSSNGVTLYGVPYSEHSSFLELKRFVQFTRPLKILPTVNNGNPASRNKMEALFKEWLSEQPGQASQQDSQTKINSWIS